MEFSGKPSVVIAAAVKEGIITKPTEAGKNYFYGNLDLEESKYISLTRFFSKNKEILEEIRQKLIAMNVSDGQSDKVKPTVNAGIVPDGYVAISKEELERLRSGQDEDIIKKIVTEQLAGLGGEDKVRGLREITDAIRAVKNDDGGAYNSYSLYKESDIDPKDWMETPVEFYAYSSYKAIWDKTVKGKAVSTPYNTPIRFEFVGVNIKQQQGSRFVDAIPVARVKIQSQKECDFLRSHPEYNITFFEKSSEVLGVDMNRNVYLERAMSMVSGWGAADIIQRARSRGVQMSDNVDFMKKGLIDKMAEEMEQNALRASAKYSSTMVAAL